LEARYLADVLTRALHQSTTRTAQMKAPKISFFCENFANNEKTSNHFNPAQERRISMQNTKYSHVVEIQGSRFDTSHRPKLLELSEPGWAYQSCVLISSHTRKATTILLPLQQSV
jgi:hypothetical protein